MSLPCIDCVCFAICKQKNFFKIKRECSIITKYLHDGNMKTFNALSKAQKRTYWRRKFALKIYFKPLTDEQITGWLVKTYELDKESSM